MSALLYSLVNTITILPYPSCFLIGAPTVVILAVRGICSIGTRFTFAFPKTVIVPQIAGYNSPSSFILETEHD